MKKLLTLTMFAPLLCFGQTVSPKMNAPYNGVLHIIQVDTTVHVSLPVLRDFIQKVYSLKLNDAQLIRLNMEVELLRRKVAVDSVRTEGTKP